MIQNGLVYSYRLLSLDQKTYHKIYLALCSHHLNPKTRNGFLWTKTKPNQSTPHQTKKIKPNPKNVKKRVEWSTDY